MKFHYLCFNFAFSLIIYSAFVNCDAVDKERVSKGNNQKSAEKSSPSPQPLPASTVIKNQSSKASNINGKNLKASAPNDIKTDKSKCPDSCKCYPDSDTSSTLDAFTVSCVQAELKIIPAASEMPLKTTSFDLSKNQIQQIDLFDVLPELITLNLSQNSIVKIEPRAFEQLTNLQSIDLSYNALSSVQDMIFANLNNLKKIDLSENDISKIEATSFDGQQWLEILNLRGNSLKSLPEDLFRNNERLRILDLSHNSMYSLPDTIFHYTPALTTIDLSENQFNEVPSEDLASATKLEVLDISVNMMKKLDHSSFSGLGSLKILRINNCKQLTEIDDYTFSYLHSLQHLEIKNNPRLNALSPSAFFGITFAPMNLTEVDLYGNQLSRLTEHTLPFCNISRIDLRDNQWRCDCHFKWVLSCKKDDPIHQQIRCTSPLQLASLEIGAINEDQFTCPVEGNGFSREIRLFRLFVILFGVLTLVFMGFMVIYYLHKAKVIRSFGHKYQRMGSIHYVKDQTTDVIQE